MKGYFILICDCMHATVTFVVLYTWKVNTCIQSNEIKNINNQCRVLQQYYDRYKGYIFRNTTAFCHILRDLCSRFES